MKYDFNKDPFPEPLVESRTIDIKGNPVEFKLQTLDIPELTLVNEKAAQYLEEFGGGAYGLKVGNRTVKLTYRLCENIAMLEAMQAVPDEDKYSFLEILQMQIKHPKVYAQLVAWSMELVAKSEEREGNG